MLNVKVFKKRKFFKKENQYFFIKIRNLIILKI